MAPQAEVEVVSVEFVNPPPLADDDGSAAIINPRIIGGVDTTIERHPHTVQVIFGSALQCGGSLITMRHVLSAAHCFWQGTGIVSPRYYSIRAGTTNLNSGGRTVSVSMIIVHERYNPTIHDCDIAVLVLGSTLKSGNQIRAIAIPAQGYQLPNTAMVTYAGWGKTSITSEQPSRILQEVTVPIVNLTICAERYAELQISTGQPMLITNNMFCAGLLDVGGKDACQGDSGGPIVYNSVLVGVTSWGYSCALPRYPGVNARVASFSNWINTTVVRYNGSGGLQGVASSLLLSALLLALYQQKL
ncbi:trypsin CFT-1-like [Achroia grisella]|uniref:trypsin CFT-1-like n=1 Tax=Achroia grisella TaxID=688607 RepID=UPI0027D2CE00|nr:trypsin CFT-1-like [Achroia grisella]